MAFYSTDPNEAFRQVVDGATVKTARWTRGKTSTASLVLRFNTGHVMTISTNGSVDGLPSLGVTIESKRTKRVDVTKHLREP